MKRTLAALLVATLLLVLPAYGDHRQEGYEKYVRWSGCTAALTTDDSRMVIESFYAGMEHRLYVGTMDMDGLSQELAEMVLFHEIGHCLQAQAGLLDGSLPSIVVELDADRWSADIACSLGRDGRRLLHDIFVWARDAFGYEGDPGHGTLAQRINQGNNAPLCKVAPPQSPLLGR